eukprot:6209444-Pleurochrysis_carterae.AAC.1
MPQVVRSVEQAVADETSDSKQRYNGKEPKGRFFKGQKSKTQAQWVCVNTYGKVYEKRETRKPDAPKMSRSEVTLAAQSKRLENDEAKSLKFYEYLVNNPKACRYACV